MGTSVPPSKRLSGFDQIMERMLPTTPDGVSPHVTSGFGVRNVNGQDVEHLGIDLNHRGGQSGVNLRHPVVHSPVEGRVVINDGPYGTVTVIDSKGWYHQVLHLDSHSVHEGQRVHAGDPIGRMGGVGPEGPHTYAQHVHYQIKDPHGREVDPREFWNKNPPEQILGDGKDRGEHHRDGARGVAVPETSGGNSHVFPESAERWLEKNAPSAPAPERSRSSPELER